jgi:MFS family permease
MRPVIVAVFYVIVVVLGILSMGFQLLGSRLLNPHFGSSIIVWAWLISTFLAAFSLGSLLGGWISSLPAARRHRLQLAVAAGAVLTLAFTAAFGRSVLDLIEVRFESVSTALLVSCVGLFFAPVTMLSCFGPQCVQYLAARGTKPGAASGVIYGISTVGNIAGVMLTAFVLLPNLRVSTLLYVWLGVAVASLAGLLTLLRRAETTPPAGNAAGAAASSKDSPR